MLEISKEGCRPRFIGDAGPAFPKSWLATAILKIINLNLSDSCGGDSLDTLFLENQIMGIW
jgi:hypothetical protein